MNKLTKTALLLVVAWSGLLCAGCDYVPRKVYEIKTADGQTIKLLCPTIDPGRNTLTYLIDGECVLTDQ